MAALTAATQPSTIIEAGEDIMTELWRTTTLVGWVLHLSSFNRTTKKIRTIRVRIEKSKIGALREYLTHEFYQGFSLDGIHPLEKYR